MTTSFTKGFIRTLTYYATGFALIFCSYLIFGHQYIHGPGVHHLIGFLFLLGGVGWILYNLLRLLHNKHDKVNLASLLVNIIIVSASIIYFAIVINNETDTETITNKADIITIYKDSSSRSASVVNVSGDTLLLKVGDSVYY